MRILRRHRSRTLRGFLLAAAVSLAPGEVLAQSATVPYFIQVNIIDVCNAAGTICSPINSMNQSVLNGANTPFGWFSSSNPGVELTQQILLHWGVNLVIKSITKWNSPPNSFCNGCDFTTLHVINDPTSQTGQSSPDLLVAAQQPNLSQVPGYMPTFPLDPDPSTVNSLQVMTIAPPAGGQIYEFSCIGNSCNANAKNAFLGVPLFALPSRPDTGAHGFMHVAGLGHNNHLAGPALGPSPPAGTCAGYPGLPGLPNCPANLTTAGGNAGANLRIEPTLACLLSTSASCASMSLVQGSADQLTVTADDSQIPDLSQQTAILSSGFLHTIGNSMFTATQGASGTSAALTTSSATRLTTSSTTGGGSKNDIFTFTMSGPIIPEPTGNVQTLNQVMDFVSVMLNKGLAVDIRHQPQILPDPNSQKYITSLEVVPGNSGNMANGYCIVPATQCILVGLKQLPAGVTVGFTAGIKINGSPATPEDLAPVPPPGGGGTRVAFVLGNLGSEGQVVGEYATASQLVFNANTGQDTAGSLTPVPTVQPMLVNSTGVPPTTSLPCSAFVDNFGFLVCSNPAQTGGVDGACQEGGQPPPPNGPTCP